MIVLWMALMACDPASNAPAPEVDPPAVEEVVAEAPAAAEEPASEPHRMLAGEGEAEVGEDGPTVCGLDPYIFSPSEDSLQEFAAKHGLEQGRAFASVVANIRVLGTLPSCYLTKREAEAKGWDRGNDLWSVAPGAAIGGDTFYNREGLLPKPSGAGYVEADLDYDGGSRGAHRLVFDPSTTKTWITTDHYESFERVP